MDVSPSTHRLAIEVATGRRRIGQGPEHSRVRLKVTPEMVERMHELYALGWTFAEIAEEMGIGQTTARSYVLGGDR